MWKWYVCDSQKGDADSKEKAIERLFEHLDWSKRNGEEDWCNGTLYYYPPGTDRVAIWRDDGAYTPQVWKEND